MSISATEGVVGSTATGFPLSSPSSTAAQEDKQMFLELMVAQLRYQDPLNPTDSGEFLAQSAQFTALEKMQDVADRTGALLGAQMAFGATAMVGQHVSWVDENGATQSGTVAGVTFGAQGPVFDIGGPEVPLAMITSVTSELAPAAPATPSTPTTESTGSGTTDPTDPATS